MKQSVRRVLHAWRALTAASRLPKAAKREIEADRAGLPVADPGSPVVISAALAWLCEAQDRSASNDGGVSRSYNLTQGWLTSYPETTGYIIPTFLDAAHRQQDANLRARARRMLEWLLHIQLESGAFQGGTVDAQPVMPVVFNTGQILLGLAAGTAEFEFVRPALRRAADWLVAVQDPDGCWRKHQSPFALAGEKTYDTHTAWGLFEAARAEPGRGYAEAALLNVRWALSHQQANGWFARCCLIDATKPLTHTIGYVLRGVLEAHRYSDDKLFLDAAQRTAEGLLSALRDDGFLPGMLSRDWSAAARWACLTGTAQVAHCWLLLYQTTGQSRYRDAAFLANSYVRRAVNIAGPPAIRGAVKGSFPIDGGYCPVEYPNWAAKFLVDSLALELDVRQRALLASAV